MTSIPTDKIAAWFNDHNDGDFARPPRTQPFEVIGPSTPTQIILYATKPQCILALEDGEMDFAAGMIGRYGLPDDDDVAWLHTFVGSRELYFLGDADPADLLVFAWLRTRIEVKHAGVSDNLLSRLNLAWNDRVCTALSESESAALDLVAEVCPDFRALLGLQCAALLDRGQKLELEAVTVCHGVNTRTLLNAIAAPARN